jgi:predicted branched-subunit amino acid permease
MISLGIVDLILVLLFVLMIYLASRRRGQRVSTLLAVLLLAVILERLVPGTLASIGTAIRGLNQVNAAGPHLQFQPIIRFQ